MSPGNRKRPVCGTGRLGWGNGCAFQGRRPAILAHEAPLFIRPGLHERWALGHSQSASATAGARFGDRLHRRKSAVRALFSCPLFSGGRFASQWRCVLGALRGCRSYARFANPARTAALLARGGGLTNCIGDTP